jgi:hypothetical protein
MIRREVVVANPHRVNRAMLAPATRKDSYRLADKWQGVGDYTTWIYGQQVEGVQQFPANGYEVGDEIDIYDLADRLGATMKVERIRMITCADITDEDIALLGYRDRDEWIDQTEGGMVERKAWLLEGQVKKHNMEGPGVPVGTIKVTNVETGATDTTIVDLRDRGSRVQ